MDSTRFHYMLQQRTQKALAERRARDARDSGLRHAQLDAPQPESSPRFQLMLNERIEKILAERKARAFSSSSSIASSSRGSSETIDSPSSHSSECAKSPLASGMSEVKGCNIKREEEDHIECVVASSSGPKPTLEQHQGQPQHQQQPEHPLEQTLEHQHVQILQLQPDPPLRGLEQPLSGQSILSGTKRSMDPATESTNDGMATPAVTQEPLAKRQKKSTPPREGSVCTCSISTKCEVAAANGVKDCRASSQPVIKKIPKAKDTGITRHEYISKRRRNEITRSNADILEILHLIKKIETGNEPEKSIPRLRDRIHYLELYEIPEQSIESIKAKFTDPQNGLPAVIRNHSHIPWDIRLDCRAILQRMEKGDFNVDLSRGILTRRTYKENGRSGLSRTIDKGYPFRESAFVRGDNHLRNGQWFPWQICALRDGAHGDIEGGISGNKSIGAVSIVLSSSGGNHTYADIDLGDTVWYCGTRGKDGEVSANTALLLEAANKKSDIRVLRSSKLPKLNPYRPLEGIRYDGLYNICDYEILDPKTALHRFKLKRVQGQTPIRYKGPEARPTAREVEELRKANEHIAKSKPAKELKGKQADATRATDQGAA
ncbi:hypothetical protein MaudCBS49596_001078 [Microsporum audouinii]